MIGDSLSAGKGSFVLGNLGIRLYLSESLGAVMQEGSVQPFFSVLGNLGIRLYLSESLRSRYAGGKRIVFPLNKMEGKVEKLDKIIFFKSIDAKTNKCTNKVVNGFFNSWSKRIRFGINIAYAHISATRE